MRRRAQRHLPHPNAGSQDTHQDCRLLRHARGCATSRRPSRRRRPCGRPKAHAGRRTTPARSPGRPAVTDLGFCAPKRQAGRGRAVRWPRDPARAGSGRADARPRPRRRPGVRSPLPVAARGPPPRSGSPRPKPEQGAERGARAGQPHAPGPSPQHRRSAAAATAAPGSKMAARGGATSLPLPLPLPARGSVRRPL